MKNETVSKYSLLKTHMRAVNKKKHQICVKAAKDRSAVRFLEMMKKRTERYCNELWRSK